MLIHPNQIVTKSTLAPDGTAGRSLSGANSVPLLLRRHSVSLPVVTDEIDFMPTGTIDLVAGKAEITIGLVEHPALTTASSLDLVSEAPRRYIGISPVLTSAVQENVWTILA